MGRHREYSEKEFSFCVILTTIGIICVLITGSIKYNPTIKIHYSKRPSCAEAESDSKGKVVINNRTAPIVRQSLGIFIVTAYCPGECCCGDDADGITACGWKINIGDKFCAADPMIPFLKVLDIEGYGIAPVLDRGGKIKGNKLDVFFWTHEEALKWGVQELEIFCWVQGE